jgi:hypothetical protein
MKTYKVIVNMISQGESHRMTKTINSIELENLKKSNSFLIISQEEIIKD